MTADDSTSFGAVLRRFRTVSGLTQEELAERAGLSRRGINDLERGARLLPRKDTVALLADALGLVGAERTAFLELRVARLPSPCLPSPLYQMGRALWTRPPPRSPRAPSPSCSPTSKAAPACSSSSETSTPVLWRASGALARGVRRQRWREVDTQGDAFFVAFPPLPGGCCGCSGTLALAAHAWPEGTTVRVRMGLHTGTPQRGGRSLRGLGRPPGGTHCRRRDMGGRCCSLRQPLLSRNSPPGRDDTA